MTYGEYKAALRAWASHNPTAIQGLVETQMLKASYRERKKDGLTPETLPRLLDNLHTTVLESMKDGKYAMMDTEDEHQFYDVAELHRKEGGKVFVTVPDLPPARSSTPNMILFAGVYDMKKGGDADLTQPLGMWLTQYGIYLYLDKFKPKGVSGLAVSSIAHKRLLVLGLVLESKAAWKAKAKEFTQTVMVAGKKHPRMTELMGFKKDGLSILGMTNPVADTTKDPEEFMNAGMAYLADQLLGGTKYLAAKPSVDQAPSQG